MTLAVLATAAALSAWPAPTREARPWVYNWWLGTDVTASGLRAQAEALRAAGFGGFHVIPAYGVPGDGAAEVAFFSPDGAARFAAAQNAAGTNGLGVDLSGAPGFTFGGPEIAPEDGFWTLEVLPEDAPARRRGATNLWCGAGADGARIKLTAAPAARRLKRASARDAGLMIDPLSPASMAKHLAALDAAFAAGMPKPRALYHDSYDYHGAAWTPRFADDFARRRGYRLEPHFAALAGAADTDADAAARVREDYRRTASELMIETFGAWTAWCRARGILTRYEAHGAPADWLALYALADIPEAEICGQARGKIPLAKFASSAAHIAGRRLVACETGTWLGNHFHVRLADLKRLCDALFLAGVNHVFYHGLCYSPPDAPWPGRLFYAATQMNPRNPFWRDLPALNAYVTRCQSLLQSCRPANDLLLYWPLRDWWRRQPGLLRDAELSVGGQTWFRGQPFGDAADWLWNNGFAFDYVSDATLAAALATGRYKAVFVPRDATLPPDTAARLAAFTRTGGTVVSNDVTAVARLADAAPSTRRLQRFAAARKDGLAALPLRRPDGTPVLFVVNQGRRFAGALALPPGFSSTITAMDALDGTVRPLPCTDGAVSLTLESNASLFLVPGGTRLSRPPPDGTRGGRGATALPNPSDRGATARPTDATRASVPVIGPWMLTPVCGGPAPFPPRTMNEPAVWSTNADGTDNPFCGTVRYEAAFDWPDASPAAARAAASARPLTVDAGDVRESARLFVNGREVGVRFLAPFRWEVPAAALRRGRNTLAIEVTSLGANRVRDLFRRGDAVAFATLGVLAPNYKPLDAAGWDLRPCGLLGPVRLTRTR